MRKLSIIGMGMLALVCWLTAKADHLIPDEFVGSYLAACSSKACVSHDKQRLPVYLVIQPRIFRYGFMNPEEDHSLDAIACRATEYVLVANGSMEMKSECFVTDRLVKKRFKFIKQAGVLRLQDLDQQTENEFEACY